MHLAVTGGRRLLLAAIYGALTLHSPGTCIQAASPLPPGVVAAAPATRHYCPVTLFDTAYSGIQVLFHVLKYIRT